MISWKKDISGDSSTISLIGLILSVFTGLLSVVLSAVTDEHLILLLQPETINQSTRSWKPLKILIGNGVLNLH